MYEMEGPHPVRQPNVPIARLPVTRLLSAADRPPAANARLELRLPGVRCVPGLPPAFRGLPRIGTLARW
jgi:hypothetical protein